LPSRSSKKYAWLTFSTLYLSFPSKAALLSEVIRLAIRGDAPNARLGESPGCKALAATPTNDVLGAFALLVEDILHDVAELLAVGDAAATDDPALADLRDRGRDAEHSTYRTVAELLHARGALAEPLSVEEATDIIYAVASPSVYLRLTRDRGWTRDAYSGWLADTLTVALLPS
jgi:AcrR family transcriptional regulator